MEADTAPAPMGFAPRFMTDEQLRAHFGLSERALRRLRAMPDFPRRNDLLNRTDSRLVDRFFDRMSGLASSSVRGSVAADTKERY